MTDFLNEVGTEDGTERKCRGRKGTVTLYTHCF